MRHKRKRYLNRSMEMQKSKLNKIFEKNSKEGFGKKLDDMKEEEEGDGGKKVIKCYTIRTRGGKNGSKDKINQDSFLANYNLNGNINTHLFGVYDGHGKPKKIIFFLRSSRAFCELFHIN